MTRVFGFMVATPVLLLALVSGCGGGADDANEPERVRATDSDEVASALVRSTEGDEAVAITGLLIAVDRGYSLGTIADAVLDGSFDAAAGAIADGDGFATPNGQPGGFITDAPVLTSAGALDRSGLLTDQSVGDVVSVVGTFLETPLEQLLTDIDGGSDTAAGSSPDADRRLPDPSKESYFRTVIILALIDSGFSPEQITEAIVFGGKVDCELDIPPRCGIKGSEPALAPSRIFKPVESSGSSSTAQNMWSGKLVYEDDTVTLEPGTSEVTVVQDDDGEFSITARLTYRTIPSTGTCSFDWEKTYAGTGVLDPGGASIAFDGTETVKSTSTCPDANVQDRSIDARRIVTVSGNTLSGTVATGTFEMAGPAVK